jgi:aminobenzoyl-glutamate transport protein
MITIIGSLVTIFIVEPKLGAYDATHADDEILDGRSMQPLATEERKGLLTAGLAALVVLAIMAVTLVPEWGPLRNPETGDRIDSPFFDGIVAWIFVFFLATGFAYGRSVGTMKNDRDVIDGMASAIATLGLYIVLVFFAAQFVAFFGWTNLGAITAVTGANFLQGIGLTGPLVFVFFILVCGMINLSLGSASAQWAVTAPIFVPMLMIIGYSPEVIQTAYRIGDSTTNIITPMMSYFGLILAWATRYNRNFGIGTMVATMLPYSIFFIIGWAILFLTWTFGLDMPVGPGSPTYYTAGQ